MTAGTIAPAASPPSVSSETRLAEVRILMAAIATVAGCGLIYELLIATVSSYLIGNSVTQFSISVGLFIGSMGIGSWLSQRIRRRLLTWFAALEILLGIVGGASATTLFWVYSLGVYYWPVLLFFLAGTGLIVGLELPLLIRVLNSYGDLRQVVAGALSVDYLGSLAGSLLFPLVLLPVLGVTRAAFLVGLVNVAVGVLTCRVFAGRLPQRLLIVPAAAAALLLAGGFAQAGRIHHMLEQRLYDDTIIYARQTAYQRIILTRWRDDLRLFLDGNLQFSTTDEYRYHEALVHPALSAAPSRRNLLVLGGGDGLAVREALRWPDVESLTLVDLDPEMTRLGRELPALRTQNHSALHDPRVRIVNDDAQHYLDGTPGLYDVIIMDLPDPNNEALAKLYSREFFRLARRRLARGGVLVTQASSPFFSREAFWCVALSGEEAGLAVRPLHTYVPSFGDWGFILMGETAPSPRPKLLPAGLRYLNQETLAAMSLFSDDIDRLPVRASTLDHPRILEYYLEGSRRWDTP